MAKIRKAQSQRANPTPFLEKIYELVDNPDNKDLVSWTVNGDSFIVKDTNVFARDLLPKHFKHNIFSSFVRQLNNYGFRKVPNNLNNNFHEWQHDKFKKGEKERLVEIKCKKSSPGSLAPSAVQDASTANTGEDLTVISSTSPRTNATSDPEIKRLRIENAALKEELQKSNSENATLKEDLQKFKSMVQNVPVESSSGGDAEGSVMSRMEIDLNRAWVGDSE